MFEQKFSKCPNCGTEMRQRLTDGGGVKCVSCSREYSVAVDEATDRIALLDMTAGKTVEPLNLPKGSIRASVTLLLSACVWLLILAGRDVPECLFGLLLAVIAYYFALRHRARGGDTRVHDASAVRQPPLFLPSGVIRLVLTLGFGVSLVVLFRNGRLLEMKYLEFFAILVGLVFGYFSMKLFRFPASGGFSEVLSHVKGVVVLGSALVLAGMLLSLAHENHPYVVLTLTAIISFYFGSRS